MKTGPIPESNSVRPAVFVTLGASGVLLTFLQLFGAWFENIYRMSLIKLQMGNEMAGILLPLLAPVLAWGMSRVGTLGLRAGVVVYIAIYALVWWPPTTPVETIVLAGIGVALLLAIAAHALAGPWGGRVDGGMAAVLATLMYITLRTFGHTLDLYAAGSPWGLLPMIALLPALCLAVETTPVEVVAETRLSVRALGLFGLLGFVYLFLSTPGTLNAWEVYRWTHDVMLSGMFLALFVVVAPIVSRTEFEKLSVWPTLLFTALLVGFLWLGRLEFPVSPTGQLLVSKDRSHWQGVCILWLAIIYPYFFRTLGAFLLGFAGQRPQRIANTFTLGTYLVVLIALLLVFTNVWGYVGPVSHALRNQFYLPFALCGMVVVISTLLLRGEVVPRPRMRFNVVSVAAILLAGAASYADMRFDGITGVTESTGDTFTLMTYNIQQGSRQDGDQAYAAQCEVIRKVNPDIVALQESDTARPSGGFVNTATYFGRSLGYYTYYGPSSISGTFGTAILSRYPIDHPRTIYTYSDADEVGTSAVDLEIAGKTVRLFNNHPSGSDAVMNAHAALIVSEAQRGGPMLATGDFNSRPSEAPYKAIAGVLHDAWATLHPDAKGPGFSLTTMAEVGDMDMADRIDHIFFSSDFEVLEAHYVQPPESQTDHPVHWARLRLR